MALLGQELVTRLREAGIATSYHWSTDSSLPTLANLYREAQAWLDGQNASRRIVVSLHSDSGSFSHVFGIFGREDGLIPATILAYAVSEPLNTERVQVFDKLGTTDYGTYLFTTQTRSPSVLIECGSHENAANLAVLTSDAGRAAIAQALLDGLVEWTRS